MRPIKQDDDVQGENFSKAKDFMIEQIKVYNQKINKDDSDDDFDDDSDDDSDNDAQFNPLNNLEVFIKDKYIVRLNSGIRIRHNFFVWAVFLFEKLGTDSVNYADSGDIKILV